MLPGDEREFRGDMYALVVGHNTDSIIFHRTGRRYLSSINIAIEGSWNDRSLMEGNDFGEHFIPGVGEQLYLHARRGDLTEKYGN